MATLGERLAQWASAATPTLRPPRRRPPDVDSAPLERASRPSRLGGALDFLSDLGVLAFAVWTLIAYIGMATEARVSLLVPVWLATVPLLGVVLAILNRRRSITSHTTRVVSPPADPPFTPRSRTLIAAALAAAIVSGLLAGALPGVPWAVVWLGAFVPVVVAVAMGRLRSEGATDPGPTLGWPADAFAALVGLGLATMSLFIGRSDADDAFYVNRATATAQLNRIPIRDVIFTDERVGAIAGAGLPTDSFSALEGALGRFIGIHGASFAYYVTPPLMTFFATWALWRLVRSWAPRNVVLCFALGCTYWLFSAQARLAPGSFFLTRMWQGKVIFAAWLIMTTYVLLTRWLSRRDAATAALLVAAGLSGIGMTGSATFVVPLLFSTAAVALLAARDWRGLPVVLVAAGTPFLIGFIVSQQHPVTLLTDKEHSTAWYFHQVFGVGVVAAFGVIALCAVPWLARSGAPARLVTGIAVVGLLLVGPGVLPTVNDVTGLTTVLRRTLWIVPLPALVGLLAAVPLAPLGRLGAIRALRQRWAAAAPAVVCGALLAAFGHPLWISLSGNSLWAERPIWRINQHALADAHGILHRYRGSEPILADELVMRAIALVTVRPKAVNARTFYARLLPESPQRIRHRIALTRFVMGEGSKPSLEKVERALADLRVGLVCVRRSKVTIIRDVETLGNYEEAFRVNGLVCFSREGGVSTAPA
jgi:hypothetical protein